MADMKKVYIDLVIINLYKKANIFEGISKLTLKSLIRPPNKKVDPYRLLQGFPMKLTLWIYTKVKIAFSYRTFISKTKGDTVVHAKVLLCNQ